MTAPTKAPDRATTGPRVSADQARAFAKVPADRSFERPLALDLLDAREQRDAALAENARLRAELATRTKERDKARGRDENLLSFAVFVWKWCNRPNVTDAERVSMIRHHPTLKAEIEPPDDGYRMGLASRTQEASHD